MNLLQICQYIADQNDGTRPATVYNADPTLVSRTIRRWRGHVNSAYTMIKQALGIRNEYAETETTLTITANTEAYSIPVGILTVQELQVATDPPIRILPWTEYERYKSDALTIVVMGSPEVASIYNRKIHFYPTPDGGYTVNVRGLGSLVSLDLDEDEPVLGEEFHQAIADLALYFEMAYENNPQSGLLAVSENGELQGQGGQAAKAVAMYRMAKKNIRNHMEDSPRMISRAEMARINQNRRITRA